MKPLVTISIPIYKCEAFLEKCLDSVKNQTYTNIEVTLINDQTPDNSVQIAENFIHENGFQNTWRIYHLAENSGLSVVRNKGIDTANGKYLFFLDSDDTISSTCIEKMVNLSEITGVDMVVGDVEGIKFGTNVKFDIFPITCKKNIIRNNSAVFESFINAEFPVSSWNKLINLSFLKSNRIYFVEGLYAQDSLHTFHMAEKLESVAILREKTYNYYLHQNSVIHNRGKKHFDNWQTIAEHIDETIKKEKDFEKKVLMLKYLINFKSSTLLMNWKAQRNPKFWKESYKNFKKLSSLGLNGYFSTNYNYELKKQNFLQNLPTNIGFKIFLKRFGL